ncbi:DUF1707 domain-containing protein [Streptomyces sp. ACA25]|uniref:DUF1707 SHOCT-like domain-containing protein n=1 Tax=Streptomyces sp. ACA25 TaxID=3022596 RepID=UPI002307193B|nr:DUF1707 domain-containing protein [Streptomyces sp. ACA25]MDB1086923.1 DUF1707 domain-containing protein [Streptomyces sp. ACA25]
MSAENPPAVPLGKRNEPAAVRASDADRDRIADILREALAEGRLDSEEHAERIDAVYRAKTVVELEPLIRDLPAGQHGSRPDPALPPHPARPAAVPGRGPATRSARNVVAILSGASRQGRWRVGTQVNAVAICGGVELDLTEALFEQQVVTVNATAICGGIEIKLPENVTVRQSGSGILGAFEVEESEALDPQAPVIVVQGVALCGGVEVRQVRGKQLRNLRGGRES